MEIVSHGEVSATGSAYGAVIYLLASLAGFFTAVVAIMALFTLARAAKGKLGATHRVTFDNVRLFWHYTVGQILVGVALVHGFPRWVG